jgi:hypothetical protein
VAYRVKNWTRFQHFKDRRPPWVKLYRDLLDDPDWHGLKGDDAKVLTMLWLIASDDDGRLPSDNKLAFRLRMPEKTVTACLSRLSHWLIQDDIAVISRRYHDDAPETETETETETEGEGESREGEGTPAAPDAPAPARQMNGAKRRRALAHFVPENFKVPDQDYQWALSQGYTPEFIRRETERFCDHEFKTGRSDWLRAWRNWISRDPPTGPRHAAKH